MRDAIAGVALYKYGDTPRDKEHEKSKNRAT
jgi:hypothetical protein